VTAILAFSAIAFLALTIMLLTSFTLHSTLAGAGTFILTSKRKVCKGQKK
jgi:hypothetical protein